MNHIVEANIDIEEGSSDGSTLVSGINQFTTAFVSAHDPERSAVLDVMASDVAASAAEMQQSLFVPRTEPDGAIRLDDGFGNEVTFEGYRTAPGYRAGESGVGNTYSLIHASSELAGYSPFIYTARFEYDKFSAKSGSIAERCLEILKTYTKNWQDVRLKIPPPRGYEDFFDQIHETNERLFPRIEELLEASIDSTTIEGLGEIPKHLGLNNSLNGHLIKTLMSRRNDFMSTIMALCTQWQLIYLPTVTGAGSGKLVQISEVLNEPEEKEAVMTNINFSGGPSDILPVTGVIVDNVAAPPMGSNKSTPPAMVVVGNAQGRLVNAPLPPFMERPLHTVESAGSSKADPRAYNVGIAKQHTALLEYIAGPVKNFVTGWARNHLVDVVLSPSQAAVTADLNLSWEVGKYYKVSGASDDGPVLFQGLLSQSSSRISSNQDNPEGSTQLIFSHVLNQDNELPF